VQIKPKDTGAGLELSEEVEASVPKVVELILPEIALNVDFS
jgi:Ni,Fe-hydrogenase maturation factor